MAERDVGEGDVESKFARMETTKNQGDDWRETAQFGGVDCFKTQRTSGIQRGEVEEGETGTREDPPR
jgi:hypothetical protein